VHGAHLFRFGGDYTRIILDKLFPQTFNGQLFFVNSPGQPGVAEDSRISKRFSPVRWTSVLVAVVYTTIEYRNNNFGVFAQMTGRCGRI